MALNGVTEMLFSSIERHATLPEVAACVVICGLVAFLGIKFFCDDDSDQSGPRDLEWWL
jgi:hypothetical protein